jgi:hypothetical protein
LPNAFCLIIVLTIRLVPAVVQCSISLCSIAPLSDQIPHACNIDVLSKCSLRSFTTPESRSASSGTATAVRNGHPAAINYLNTPSEKDYSLAKEQPGCLSQLKLSLMLVIVIQSLIISLPMEPRAFACRTSLLCLYI